MDNDGTTNALPAPGRTQRMAYVLLSPRPKSSSTIILHGPYQSDRFIVSTSVPSEVLGRGHRVKRPKLSPPLATPSDLDSGPETQESIPPTKIASSSRKRGHASGSRAWCHQCHRPMNIKDAQRCSTCGVGYCEKCLLNRYGAKVKATPAVAWLCPRCAGYCDCGACVRKRRLDSDPKRSKAKSSTPPLPPPHVDDTGETVSENIDVKRDGPRTNPSIAPIKTEIEDVKLPAIPSFSVPFSPEIIRKDGLRMREATQYYSDAYFLIDQKPTDLFDNHYPFSDTTLHSMSPYASPDAPTPSHHPIIVPDASYYSHKYSQFYSCDASSASFLTFHDSIVPSQSSPSHVPSLINNGDATPLSPIAPPSYEWRDFHVLGDGVDFPLEEAWNSIAQCSHISPASCTCLTSAAARLDDAETFARFINIDLLEETSSYGVILKDQ